MSSNFTVNRLCEQCGKVFEAKTTVTRFCSKLCNKRNSKTRHRGLKMASMDEVVKKVLDKKGLDVSAMEFLSVKAAGKLLGASERIIYGMIANGKLNAINLSKRKTVVFRKDIDRLFELPTPKPKTEEKTSIEDCYHMGEAQSVFNISEKALYDIIKRNSIPKFQEGKFTYVPKFHLNKILNPADHV
jgi:predicted DNA-binding transcriptional regulator AlpA